MVNLTILAGGYDAFIAAYLFNTHTSTLSLLNQYPSGPNPSWITAHATKNIIYATNEVENGSVQSFTVTGPRGVLSSAIDTVPSAGDIPAFVASLSTGQVAVMNYVTGNGRIIPTDYATALDFDDSAGVITFPPPPGGGQSNAHMALEYGKEVLVPDLGGDNVWRLIEDGSPGNWRIAGSIKQPTGSGPRHIAVRADLLYTLHQTTNALSVQAIPALGTSNTSALLATASIIPPDVPSHLNTTFNAAELLIPTPNAKYPVPYIYASNRNVGPTPERDPRGDTIAIFEYECTPGRGLVLVAQVYTGLDQIRGMEFGGEDDEYLMAGGVEGGAGVAVFRRTEKGRNLEVVARNADVLVRTSFVWL